MLPAVMDLASPQRAPVKTRDVSALGSSMLLYRDDLMNFFLGRRTSRIAARTLARLSICHGHVPGRIRNMRRSWPLHFRQERREEVAEKATVDWV